MENAYPSGDVLPHDLIADTGLTLTELVRFYHDHAVAEPEPEPEPEPESERGKILYAVGGYNGNPLTTAERYDPDLNSWTPIASMGTRRSSLALTTLNNNLYAVGGYD
eukprot:COSAG05_NODE_8915_length_661_cov_1.354093_1_plen_107_part_01